MIWAAISESVMPSVLREAASIYRTKASSSRPISEKESAEVIILERLRGDVLLRRESYLPTSAETEGAADHKSAKIGSAYLINPKHIFIKKYLAANLLKRDLYKRENAIESTANAKLVNSFERFNFKRMFNNKR